ncbi:hypothetical protein BDR03DRAFT_732048 [Suillus americanus]|nr:hypothetical protein BDR03DRAFT_732048 [Suillus americanus]
MEQDLRIHYPSDCWFISRFFPAARLINTLMAVHTQCSSSKVNRKVQSGLRLRHRSLSLTSCWRPSPQYLLLLILVLRHVRQSCSCGPFHCGFVSHFFSDVHLPPPEHTTDYLGMLTHLGVPRHRLDLKQNYICTIQRNLLVATVLV